MGIGRGHGHGRGRGMDALNDCAKPGLWDDYEIGHARKTRRTIWAKLELGDM